jgi:hypothetical protein
MVGLFVDVELQRLRKATACIGVLGYCSNWGKTREISEHPVFEPWFEARTTCIRRKWCQLQPSVWNVSMYLWTATQIELDLISGQRSFTTKCSTFLSYFLQPPFWQLPHTACVSNLIVLRQRVLCSVVWTTPGCLQYIITQTLTQTGKLVAPKSVELCWHNKLSTFDCHFYPFLLNETKSTVFGITNFCGMLFLMNQCQSLIFLVLIKHYSH